MGIAFYSSFAMMTFMLAPAHWTSAKNAPASVSPRQAHEAAMHNAASNVLPQLLTPPSANMGAAGYRCQGKISFDYPDDDSYNSSISYTHNCRPGN